MIPLAAGPSPERRISTPDANRRHLQVRATTAATAGYLDSHPDADAKIRESINLISGLKSLGGRMLLQLAQTMNVPEEELLRIMGQRIAYRT